MKYPDHWHDYRAHKCGCITYFDIALWQSTAPQRCADHGALELTERAR